MVESERVPKKSPGEYQERAESTPLDILPRPRMARAFCDFRRTLIATAHSLSRDLSLSNPLSLLHENREIFEEFYIHSNKIFLDRRAKTFVPLLCK